MIDLCAVAQFLLVCGSLGACVVSGIRRVQFSVAFIVGCSLLCGFFGYTIVAFLMFISFCSMLLFMTCGETDSPFSWRKEIAVWCVAAGAVYCGHLDAVQRQDVMNIKTLCAVLVDKYGFELVVFLCVLSCVFLSVQDFVATVERGPRAKKASRF